MDTYGKSFSLLIADFLAVTQDGTRHHSSVFSKVRTFVAKACCLVARDISVSKSRVDTFLFCVRHSSGLPRQEPVF
jgi:hypothetical protein